MWEGTNFVPFFFQINDVRKILGPIADKLPMLCSDASISRYLRARNWNTKKAAKMLKNTLKWSLEFRPEMIQWVYASSTFGIEFL